jgi:DNA excision repair protein ERCC-3
MSSKRGTPLSPGESHSLPRSLVIVSHLLALFTLGGSGSAPTAKRVRRAAAKAGNYAGLDPASSGSGSEDSQDEQYKRETFKLNRRLVAAERDDSDEEFGVDEAALAMEAANDDYEESDPDEFVPEKRGGGGNKGKGKATATSKGKGKAKASGGAAGGGGLKVKLSKSSKSTNNTDTGSLASSSKLPTIRTPGVAVADALISSTFRQDRDYGYLPLRPDQVSRPFYIVPSTGHIILENFHPLAKYATDFLVAIAEPVSRPKFIHEYKLTPHSLYAAVSVGLETENIIEVLNRMSKVPVPDELCDFIRECTHSYGKVKMVLKKNKHFVESGDPETLRILLRDEVIAKARVPVEVSEQEARDKDGTATFGLEKDKAPSRAGLVIPGTKEAGAPVLPGQKEGGAGSKDTNGQNGGVNEKGKEKESDEDLFTAVVGLEKGKSARITYHCR